MIKKSRIILFSVTLLLVFGGLLTGGCAAEDDPKPEGEGFAIYLTEGDIPPDDLIMVSHIEPSGEPVIANDDIISYDAQTHEIRLEQSGIEKISLVQVPMRGRSFVVCVDKAPVYAGAFWSMASSYLFQGIIINHLPGLDIDTIRISMGYPTDSYYQGGDVRNDATVMRSLKAHGKLVNELPSTLMDSLPSSMKGYELYSWKENGEWHFRLITGTNRNKTYDEIVNGENTLDGWGSIKAVGIDGIESVLSKVPTGTEVIWFSGEIIGGSGTFALELPEESITESIRWYCGMCGVDITIPR